MKLAHLVAATAVTAGALVGAAAPAQAHLLDVIVVEDAAPCPSGYGEILQADQTTVCLHVRVPEYKIITNGDPCNTGSWDSGWTEYSVLNEVRVCLRLTHA